MVKYIVPAFVSLFLAFPADATELRTRIELLISDHDRIAASAADLDAAGEREQETLGEWYPTLDLTTFYGYEKQNKPTGSDDTSMPPRSLSLSLSQRVWDFGSTNASIRRAGLEVDQAEASLLSTRQNLILDSLNAYLNVLRQRRLLRFNEGSIANVKRQMNLENDRVERGSGLATDVLQAKSQLAGLEATHTRIQGALRNSINRYRAVYGEEPPKSSNREPLPLPTVPQDMLPLSLEDAITVAIEGNPRLRATYMGTLIAKENIKETKASEFYPSLDLVAERNIKEDESGTVDRKHESLIKLELTYSLNLGLTARNTLRASELADTAGIHRFHEDRDLIVERVNNAWNDLETARLRVKQLNNQTNIASEFLELARRERQLGNRSLIDVLAGETALINATSDAASAEIDIIQSSYRLLAAMGELAPEAIH